MYGRFCGLLGHGGAGGSSLVTVPLSVPEQADQGDDRVNVCGRSCLVGDDHLVLVPSLVQVGAHCAEGGFGSIGEERVGDGLNVCVPKISSAPFELH